jgi:hypothetical protein
MECVSKNLRRVSHISPGPKLWMPPFHLLLLAVLLCGGCKKSQQISSVTAPSPVQQSNSPAPKIEACSLITKEEVGAVQSTTISDTKSSEGPGGNYLITQCYYAATGPNLSVSLAVTQRDPKDSSAPSPREQWEETFGGFDKENEANRKPEELERKGEKGRGRDGEEGENKQPPKKIDEVGEAAFWSGGRFGGALYVLKKDVILRISVGGPDNEQTKIEKPKTLAQKALSRL